ncbi:methionine adenosyltransferase [Trueperella pyogenes]|uniref:methionine adenosyltransferase n=1 Tax=Trueperella pyogenes TaxID=1661 RepID=UPI00345DA2AC
MTVRTAEAVCIGHPDKLCDLIADTILDDVLLFDKSARTAVEVMAAGHTITVTGEVTSKRRVDARYSVRRALRKAGYQPWCFRIRVRLRRQSADIAGGVNTSLEARFGENTAFALQGAGDQGTVYGYATRETNQLMPLPLVLAQNICRRLDQAREEGTITGIRSDGKAQVSVAYDENDKPAHVTAVVVSIQHSKDKDLDLLAREVTSLIINPACEPFVPLADDALILVNPSGKFVSGGPVADTGLTGRKLAVDAYGGLAAHGGGAFSGKDASKVDRSAAYMARRIARTVLNARLADRVTVAISYAIGKADPVAFQIDTHGTGTIPDSVLTDAAKSVFPLRPAAIIDQLDLRRSVFARTATYGHFGDDGGSWETGWKYVDALEQAVKQREDHSVTD